MCADKEIKLLLATRQYLVEHPDAKFGDVIQDTGATEQALMFWIKEGKLEGYGYNLYIPCSGCGRPTRGHRLCPVCRSTLQAIARKITGDEKKQR